MQKQTTIDTVPSAPGFIAREQAINFEISGLIPNTVHHMYFERSLVSSTRIKPVNGNLGDSIKTDADGKVTFDFFYGSDLPRETAPASQNQRFSDLQAGIKEVVVVTSTSDSLADDYQTTALSYFTTFLTASTYVAPVQEFAAVKNEEQLLIGRSSPPRSAYYSRFSSEKYGVFNLM
jgi:hypothetical protein